ncbi:hypothetical protein Btru_027017 [Bulinus truncatus]|nr:hypothetical protein Btru_027017 [Bulinus truncatus]
MYLTYQHICLIMAASHSIQETERQPSILKRKADQLKKTELLHEIQKCNVQIQALEKEKLTHVYSKRSELRNDFISLEEEELKVADERKTESMKTKQQLDKMSHMVTKFHKELKDVKPTAEFVEKLKLIMEEIEGTINAFKEQQKLKYDELMRLERTLFQEIQQMDSKFESWNQSSNAEIKISGKSSSRTSDMYVTKDLPPEIAAFDKFVHESGGHRGGWDEHDHQTFLRYRNIHKGRIIFLDHLKPLLPTRTEIETREHETWYQEYIFLNENKKYAIKKWREKKEDEKEDALMQVQDELEKAKEEEKRQLLEGASIQDKVERCKMLNAWRVHKELEKAMKEEKTIKKEIEKKKKQEEDRKKQLETKKKVEEFRQQQQMQEAMINMLEEERKQQEAERRKDIIAKEISRFRKRDLQHLFEKQRKEREKEEKEKEKLKKLEALKSQVAVEVQRDPERLLQPTAGWKERLKDSSPTLNGPVIHMPHRAVPSWRQGLH